MSKAQSAMEFLMTYGWAILIMLTVIAILFYLGVFSPATVSPNACVLPAGFSCHGYKVTSGSGDDGRLCLILLQTTGHTINITKMACSDQENPAPVDIHRRLYNGETLEMSQLTCLKADGSPPGVGDYYRGTLYINYTDETTNIDHQISGEIAYKVEQQIGPCFP